MICHEMTVKQHKQAAYSKLYTESKAAKFPLSVNMDNIRITFL